MLFALLAVGFAPPAMRSAAAPRSVLRSVLRAPMTDLTLADLPVVEFELPQHGVADMALRHGVYAARMFAGWGIDGALAASGYLRDLRLVATASTVGTVQSAKGVAAAWHDGAALTGLKHASMLLLHPFELVRLAKRVAPGSAAAGAWAPLNLNPVGIASTLWLLWIACAGLLYARSVRGAEPAERRTLTLRLCKLALDVPIATHFLLGGHLLPLTVVGALGLVSSFLGLRAALGDPANPAPVRLRVPMPLLALGTSESIRRVWGEGEWRATCARRFGRPSRNSLPLVPTSTSAIIRRGGPPSPSPRCLKCPRKIEPGPLGRSCDW